MLRSRSRKEPPNAGRILLAEDDHDLRFALARMLEQRGFHVRAVATGTKLLEELADSMVGRGHRRPYDLIVTDIRMPGRDGLSVLAGLRRDGWADPIVVISAYCDDEVRERVEQLGAVFMPKPLEPHEFEEALVRMCRRGGPE